MKAVFIIICLCKLLRSQLDSLNGSNVTVESLVKDADKYSVDEKLQRIVADAPHLVGLLSEFKDKVTELQNDVAPVILSIRNDEEENAVFTDKAKQFFEVKYQLLVSYCTHIAFLLMLRAKREDSKDHPVFEKIFNLRTLLEKLDSISTKLYKQVRYLQQHGLPRGGDIDEEELEGTEEEYGSDVSEEGEEQLRKPSSSKMDSETMRRLKEEEEEFERLYTSSKKKSKKKEDKKSKKKSQFNDYGDDNYGDNTEAMRNLSKFQNEIYQTSNKNSIDAISSRNMLEGDGDLKWRDKDVIEKSGKRKREEDEVFDDDLDDGGLFGVGKGDEDFGDEGAFLDDDMEEDALYKKAAQKAKKKKIEKELAHSAAPRLAYKESQLEDGENRPASQKILKNRGLVPHRAKINRNPRLKKRVKYAKALKNRKGAVASIRTGEVESYGGESSGIRKDIAKSRRLA
jgi:U3 small nucleolar RNA-associated protein 3